MKVSSSTLVSVCLITYNHAKFIGQAMESVLSQKLDFAWELIVADDCSTDGTTKILIDYQRKFPKYIRLILQKKNVGAAQNWLDLMNAARSKYIAYLDGDDFWTDPMKLKKQVRFLEKNPRYAGCYHNTLVVHEDQSIPPHLFRRKMRRVISVENTFSKTAPFHTSSFVFRRETLSMPDWLRHVKSGDIAWFSIVASRGLLRRVGEVASVYRKHDGGITKTTSILRTYHEDRIALMEHLNEFHQRKYVTTISKVIKYHNMQIQELGETDGFVNLEFSVVNLDKYLIRTSIKNALDWSLGSIKGRLLDAGCGKMPYREYILKKGAVREYIGLDIETALIYDENIKPDYTWDGKVMPFEDDSFDSCIAIEVLEHCPEPEVFLKEVNRVLKPGGIFFFTVPFLWNLHEVPHDEYRYTPFALERHLKSSGFKEIEIKAAGGWHAALAQMLGMWVRRSPMSERKRQMLSVFLKPVISLLIKKDKYSIVDFSESQMITGLYGMAKK